MRENIHTNLNASGQQSNKQSSNALRKGNKAEMIL